MAWAIPGMTIAGVLSFAFQGLRRIALHLLYFSVLTPLLTLTLYFAARLAGFDASLAAATVAAATVTAILAVATWFSAWPWPSRLPDRAALRPFRSSNRATQVVVASQLAMQWAPTLLARRARGQCERRPIPRRGPHCAADRFRAHRRQQHCGSQVRVAPCPGRNRCARARRTADLAPHGRDGAADRGGVRDLAGGCPAPLRRRVHGGGAAASHSRDRAVLQLGDGLGLEPAPDDGSRARLPQHLPRGLDRSASWEAISRSGGSARRAPPG